MPYAATGSSSFYPKGANAQPYFGVVENTVQALRLVYAVRLGTVPSIIRRLNDAERKEKIVSGAVFVFCVEESGMKRWTDGRNWSPSRIDGNFLVYREMNEKSRGPRKVEHFEEWMPGNNSRTPTVQEQRGQPYGLPGSTVSESNTGNGRLKAGGLVKKTITVKINNLNHHIISYYTQEDVDVRRIPGMSTRPDIMNLELPPQVFRFSEFRVPPRVIKGPNGLPKIVCEPEKRLPPEIPPSEGVKYPADEPDRINHEFNLSHWKPRRERELMPLPAIEDISQLSSTGHVQTESYQEQSDSLQMDQINNPQQVRWPSPATPSEQYEYGQPFTYNSTSPYQGLDSSHGYNAGQYTSSSPASETYLRLSLMQDERHRPSYQGFEMREIVDGGSNETRPEGAPIWLPTTSQSEIRLRTNTPLPASNFNQLAHHHGVGVPWPSHESTLFEALQQRLADSRL